MLMRILSPLFSANPHRLFPQFSMRTFPLFSSVAQMPSGVVGAGRGAAATGAGCGACAAGAAATAGAAGVLNPTEGEADVDATIAGAEGALLTEGAAGWVAGAWATGAGAACCTGGFELAATLSSSSERSDFKLLKLKPEPERPGA